MANILILYSTTDGHTLVICQRIQQVMEQCGDQVVLLPIKEATESTLRQSDTIVVGASIRYGKHRPSVYDFIRSHRRILDRKPNAFFSVNLVARKPDKNQPETNPYLKKFLRQVAWQPRHVAVFAGKINYPAYSFWERQIIRLIMWLTKGPTTSSTVKEYTDWQQVREFARRVSTTQ